MDPKQDDQSAAPNSQEPQVITPNQNGQSVPTAPETPPTPVEPTSPPPVPQPSTPDTFSPPAPQDIVQPSTNSAAVQPETPSTAPTASQPESPADPAQTPPANMNQLRGNKVPAPTQAATPPASDAETSQVAGIPAMQSPKSPKSKKKLLLLIAVPILVVLTAVGIFLGLKVFNSGIALVEYSGDDFSISYPEGYEEKTQSGLVYFEEPLENPDATGTELEELEKTQSGIIVGIQEIPASLSDEQKGLVRDQYEKAGDEFAEGIAGDGQEVKNQETTTDIDLAGMPAKRITAELYEGDEKVADISVVFALNDERLVVVAVLAHVSDSSVAEKSQKIIDSFKLAE